MRTVCGGNGQIYPNKPNNKKETLYHLSETFLFYLIEIQFTDIFMLLYVSISYDYHGYGTIYIKQASTHLDYLKIWFPPSEISSLSNEVCLYASRILLLNQKRVD